MRNAGNRKCEPIIVPVLSSEGQKRLLAWLGLAVASLVGAGLFAALVALSRTPGIADHLSGGDYLRIGLVAHVTLAVSVWFLVFQGVLWVLSVERQESEGRDTIFPSFGWVGFWTAVLGTTTLVIPALLGWGKPVLVNYIPVLSHPVFFTGLVLFALGIGGAALYTLLILLRQTERPWTVLQVGGAVTAGLVLTALSCFALAGLRLHLEAFALMDSIERVVWGGGHVLQFANTAAMVLVWWILARLTLGREIVPQRWMKRILILYLIFALPSPFLYFGDFPQGEFTLLMAIGLGPMTAIVLVLLVRSLMKHYWSEELPWGDPRFAGLILSLALFGLGGSLSLMIRGSNVIIPAHYHGVIGGVTVAFMGLSYHLVPELGRRIWSFRLARIQPYLYGVGQALFVLGLFWAGAHGVPRKTFGAAQSLDQTAQVIGMALMGVGGLVAILGGIAFIGNMIPSLISRRFSRPEFREGGETIQSALAAGPSIRFGNPP
jgi:heme/copper-type cytochrome/quinol oxidase subunit 1